MYRLPALAILFLVGTAAAEPRVAFHNPPGQFSTSWVGNSFPGDGGPNGFGFWVQNGADEIKVGLNGTVFAGTDWDEAGRCLGLYRDGQVNRVLVKQEGPGVRETAWGWNTGTHALAVDGTNVFIGNKGGRFLRFSWTPGDLDSVRFVREFAAGGILTGLAAHGDRLALAYSNRLELRRAADFSPLGTVPMADLRDVVIAPDASFWVIMGATVRRLDPVGNEQFVGLAEVDKPTALAFDQRGRLIVCDDGPDQQVKFFQVNTDPPRLISTFGDKGGLRSGFPGQTAPTKLYALRGAGTDAAGNLYVAMGFNGAPVGTLVLRSFDPEGKLRWELANHAFVDTFGFDPYSDGQVIYSRTALFDLDLDSGKSGLIWKQRATTLDAVTYPEDPRAGTGATAIFRSVAGQPLLFTIGQYGGGYRLFAFDHGHSYLARPAGRVTAEGETWAWDVAANGDIWHGDGAGKTIRRHAFLHWNGDGTPRYETDKPQTWPWPDDFTNIRRILYITETDTLYLSGYLKGQEIDSWGVTGKTLRRYDDWLKGKPTVRWTIDLPVNATGGDDGKALSPEALSVAGDYIFVGMVKPEGGKQPTHILRVSDGGYVGTLAPGPEVGGNAGWQDMPYSVASLKRKNGEYLVLVEEDWRGKNLLYRWKP